MSEPNPEAVGDGTDRPQAAKRGRGRPRQLDLPRITAAARSIAPEALTMQAVADELGVNPKALNYHVGDRNGLRELVALDIFETELRRVILPTDSNWQEVVRSYAAALRDAVVQVGVLATSITLPGTAGIRTLGPVELVLKALVQAGFDTGQARATLTLVTETAFACGLHAIRIAGHGEHPDVTGLIDALQAADAQDLVVLRELVESSSSDDDQLEFRIAVLLAGLERVVLQDRLAEQ